MTAERPRPGAFTGRRPLRPLWRRATVLGCLLAAGALPAAGARAAPASSGGSRSLAEGPATAGVLRQVATPMGARARLAELWLELAQEARRGVSSSLFSQVPASSAVELPPATAGRVQPRAPERGEEVERSPSAQPPRAPGAIVVPPAAAVGDSPRDSARRGESRSVLGAGEEVEVVLEPGRAEEDAARLARESGLEVTDTRRSEDGALVATMRAPLVADPERTREALRELEGTPEVVEVRSSGGGPLDLGATEGADEGAESVGEAGAPELSDVDELARELLGEELPQIAPIETGVPWRFVLGMLTSLGLLVIAGMLWWSAQRDGGGSP